MADEMTPTGEAQPSLVQRDEPQIDESTRRYVAGWQKKIIDAKAYHEKAFDRMRANMEFARLGADADWKNNDNYTVNIVQRHINQAVASLYAKNPRAIAKKRKRLEYTVWDGTPETLVMAQQALAADPMNQEARALLADVEDAQQRKALYDRMAKTAEILFSYYIDEQQPSFKKSLKRMVRRTKVCGVGYLELGFQRSMERRPEVTEEIATIEDQLNRIEALTADMADGEIDMDASEAEELRLTLKNLREKEFVVSHEGPVVRFPTSTSIVVDPNCRDLNGFLGANWLVREYMMWPRQVEATYKIDIHQTYTGYDPDKRMRGAEPRESDKVEDKREKQKCAVWKVFDKDTGMTFTIVDGYPDFASAPKEPDVKLERFWPIFALTFNDVEDEDNLFPPSDVEFMRDPQQEYNRSRQGLREHRQANRPKYFAVKGRLENEDKTNLESHPAHAVIELNSLNEGESVRDLIQKGELVPIDPAMYDTNPVFEDIVRTVGSQEANFGTLSKATATESSIAESGRMSVQSSNVDDLDEFLTEFAEAMGQLMMIEVSADTAREIAGPGAAWPQLSAEQVAKEIFLSIKAGSTGRPNKAAELANFERAAPFLLQIPGISPTYLARKVLEYLDSDTELDEAIVEGMPSIVATNAAAGKQIEPSTGDEGTDPNAQGSEGGENAPAPDESAPGSQPEYPAGNTVANNVGF